jgi:hypothetical protein
MDQGRLNKRTVSGKKIALKYCGGCDPEFDRVKYFKQIQNAAGDLLEWVTMDDPDFETVLIISGCDTACPVEKMVLAPYRRIVSVRDNKGDPAEVVQSLLGEGKS